MTTKTLTACCPGCRATVRLPEEWLGKTVRCIACGFTARPVRDNEENAVDTFVEASRVRYRPDRSNSGLIVVATMLATLLIGGTVAYWKRDVLFPAPSAPVAKGKSGKLKPAVVDTKDDPTPASVAIGPYPRRMLVVSINNYLYANPTLFGVPARSPAALLERLADKYRIPRDQLFLLCDAPSNRGATPPLKPIVESVIESYLASSRPQDRIILLFAGHTVVVEGKPYLVPFDGELKDASTLIPFAWLYERLAACKARQKVLIVDTARADTSRGSERPSPGPLAVEIEAVLKAPPAGVQVWASASAGQQSYEYKYQAFDGNMIEGGLFLNQILNSFAKTGIGIPKPEDSLPVEALATAVGTLTTAAALGIEKQPQVPFLAGAVATEGADADSAEAPATKVVIPKPAAFAKGGLADPKLVAGILKEIHLPPIKATTPGEVANAEDLEKGMPFSAEALKDYAADYESVRELLDKPTEYPLRVAVLKTVEVLERHGRGQVRINGVDKTVGTLNDEFTGPSSDDVKKTVALDQKMGPAMMVVELEDALRALEKMKPERAKETSKRWQANHDYVLAMIKARFAYVNEYNFMLGKIRKDELPPIDPKIHKGWRLAAEEKMKSPREYKDQADEARKLFERLIKEHPGTPWEILAKRDKLTALGLTWQPTALKN